MLYIVLEGFAFDINCTVVTHKKVPSVDLWALMFSSNTIREKQEHLRSSVVDHLNRGQVITETRQRPISSTTTPFTSIVTGARIDHF